MYPIQSLAVCVINRYLQMCCGTYSWLYLCAELLKGPHTETVKSTILAPHFRWATSCRNEWGRLSSQWSYSTRFCQSRPDSNEIFLKRRMLSCCSVDMQLTWDRQNWHTVNWPDPGCSFITFGHKIRLVDFTPVWSSRGSVAVLVLLPKEVFESNPKALHAVKE